MGFEDIASFVGCVTISLIIIGVIVAIIGVARKANKESEFKTILGMHYASSCGCLSEFRLLADKHETLEQVQAALRCVPGEAF